MKGNRLRRAILLGLTMTVAISAVAMAEYNREPVEGNLSSITSSDDDPNWDSDNPEWGLGSNQPRTYRGDVSFTNEDKDKAAIHLTDTEGRDVYIAPAQGTQGSITLNSDGSGIRTEGTPQSKDTHTIHLTSGGDNVIYFNQVEDSTGNGIDVKDHAGITLEAANGNYISSNNEGDGINLNYTSQDGAHKKVSSVTLKGQTNEISVQGQGIDVQGDGNVTLQASDTNTITVFGDGKNGINHLGTGTIEISEYGENTATVNTIEAADGDGVHVSKGGTVDISGQTNTIKADEDGIYVLDNDNSNDHNSKVTVTANNGSNKITGTSNAVHLAKGSIKIEATTANTVGGTSVLDTTGGDNTLIGGENGVNASTEDPGDNGIIDIIADNTNTIAGADNGIVSDGDYTIEVTAGSKNVIGQGQDENGQVVQSDIGINAKGGTITVEAKGEAGSNTVFGTETALSANGGSNISITAGSKNVIGQVQDETNQNVQSQTGINAQKGTVTVKTTGDQGVNYVFGQSSAITAGYIDEADTSLSTAGSVTLSAANNQVFAGGLISPEVNGAYTLSFGKAYGINALNGEISLAATDQNVVYGAVYASGADSKADIGGLVENGALQSSKVNQFLSAAVIDEAGGLMDKSIISSLYAEDGAAITVKGQQNLIRTYADADSQADSQNQFERAVWAYDKAHIDITGMTVISTGNYDAKANSDDIAIAAGSAIELTPDIVNQPVADRAVVTLNYDSYTDGKGQVFQSSITGDILAAYAGQVDIKPADGASNDAKINITGNLLAGNNGVLNVNLGNGGTLTGRADDYGDAGAGISDDEHGSGDTDGFFNPAFSSKIYKGGVINLTMGDNSRWNVTGQSWITSIDTSNVDTSNAENIPVIDLVNANTDHNTYAHALTVYNMKGDAIFNMSLNGDRSVSDMLYMKTANGSYIVNVFDPVTQEDMYAKDFDGLRFATVGKGSNATFRAITYDQGVNNIEYEVGTDKYDNNDENQFYNSTETNGSGNTEKPGDTLVDTFFTSTDKPGVEENPAANTGIMLMAATEDMGTNTEENGTTVESTTNYKLIGVKNTELSDAGKTVVSMSKVNYSNAIYMDRLNKRMGEARYLDGDEGLWVRVRHDRIGKSDAFRSKNTMMELGYDKRVNDREDGEHRQGVVLDYMRGTASYDNVIGDGDVRRGGLWLYDTWLGDKGHYSDYVLKFGRLSNDFDIYAHSTGEKIHGDYSNFVYSASAEYGRKKDLGNNWYVEPQTQIQYAHVTDADYTTSQGTQVDLDAIDSLIGRVGFRLGRDLGEKSTFYVKADVLHEFLGDQDIAARDTTGLLNTTYENEGTWYDVGLGFSHQFSKGTYMFLDVEKTFGNDNEDTYQFNVGMNWKV